MLRNNYYRNAASPLFPRHEACVTSCCQMNIMQWKLFFFISLCCSTFHRIGVFRLLTYFKTAVCFISEFLFMTKQFCRCYSIMSTYSPEGKATVTRKAMTKSHGQLMWRPTLPGCGSTWASLAGSCTTGKTPT